MPKALKDRKFVHMSFVVDRTAFWDVMEAIEGKAIASTIKYQPVKHGGSDEKTGAIRSMPTGREFMMAFIAKHPNFQTREAVAAAPEGMSKASIYATIDALMHEKVIKRVAKATYMVTNINAPKIERGRPKKAAAKKSAAKVAAGKPPKAGTTASRIIEMLIAQGGEVPIQEIKAKIEHGSNSVSPTLASLLKKKIVLRPKPSVYMINPDAPAAASEVG